MTQPLVECVPNFSEGRDKHKIKAITDAIEAVAGARLLDIDPGADTHRTVVTFVAPPEAALQAAFAAIAKAAEVIDMRGHRGEHPRMGATDVCPFVPVSGVTMEQCAELARRLGRRVGDELGIPVYLYEAAASRPERRNLADIRKGEYEGLAAKLADPAWVPDFGPAQFVAKHGATVLGARPFLIAYNVSLNTRDKGLATDIAFELREKGRVARAHTGHPVYARGPVMTYAAGRYPCGNCAFVAGDAEAIFRHCRDAHAYDLAALLRQNEVNPDRIDGQKVYRAGHYTACKAIGWYVDSYQRAQISINLTDYTVTPPHAVLDKARALADDRGLVVTGSEIVGLVPAEALVQAGRHYLRRQGKSPWVPLPDVLATAVQSMGLGDVQPFDLDKKVIGLAQPGPLVRLPLHELVDEVARDTPAPGGGSVAALCGALGAGLAAMVANLTQAKPEFAAAEPELLSIAEAAQAAKEALVHAVDADTDAFSAYMAARRLPAATDSERQARQDAMQAGLQVAIEVPLHTARTGLAAMRAAQRALLAGNPASWSDAAVGCAAAQVAVFGGVCNARINLKDIADAAYVAQVRTECARLTAAAAQLMAEVDAAVQALG
ncbi:MAG: glutamate formimidoyltransferase [Deltaproteobacteria bacterium]|nr:glutamate formimidoyltransferase [Deltaproteobacteria bacterium]